MAELAIPSSGQIETLKNGGSASVTKSRWGALAAATTELVHISTRGTVIDYLEFSSNSSDAQLLLSHYDGANYNLIGQVQLDGSELAGFDMANIVIHGAHLFDIIIYDATANKFKVALRKAMTFPKGVKVEVKNNNVASKNVACRLYGREM